MYFTYKNALVHYQIKGNIRGKTVLAVHGFTENLRIWKPLRKALENDFRFLLPDLLGHGKSEASGEVLSMEEQADMLHALMDFQGIEKAVLVGHSMGGYIALAFAELYPGRTEAIILLNSHPFADGNEKMEARRQGIRVAQQDKIKYLSTAIPSFFAPYNREIFRTEIQKLVEQAASMPLKGITGALLGMLARKDRSALLLEQKLFPAAWLVSRDDPLINAKLFEEKAAQASNALFFRIMDGGHMSYVENPEEMIAYIQEFLKQLK